MSRDAAGSQHNRIDLIRPDAPELAPYGEHAIGVRTIDLLHRDQVDILNVEAGKEHPRYDRKLTLEIWYPADTTVNQRGHYDVFLRDGITKVKLSGRAVRDAAPKKQAAPFPLVIISHGYPGNRYLLSHLAENLASKGYVVASIDHLESTYRDQGKFGSTLVNRPLDQKFVLSEMDRLSKEPKQFLEGLVDATNTAVIGYSMGGYGAVITAGGGVTEASTAFEWGAPDGTLAVNMAGSETLAELVDERVKAVIAIAPWGMQRGFWNAKGLEGVSKPILFMAGSADDVSGYEDGVKAIYEGAVNAPERYLLTFENANHNAAAPIPAPVESWKKAEGAESASFGHYADPVWDTVRMNNIAQHFATAFLGKHIKGEEGYAAYLEPATEKAADGVWAVKEDGSFEPEHTYWKGFAERTGAGLSLMRATAGE
ncbi:MAG: dienelactone hydrolase [Rhizobiaceae bacterium]|nr:dienelactone hydrolase [Rhizobiaceae bacterium]MCV0408107.1 dienelactone hydrolase [Rhizobiaceae bacterium]